VFRSGRNRLRIYLSAKEQGVQECKEQAADLSECRGTGVQEGKEQVVDLSDCQRTVSMSGRNRLGFISMTRSKVVYCLGLEGTGCIVTRYGTY
jgi:hypothetical protein